MKSNEQEKCPTCNGTRKITQRSQKYQRKRTVDCPDCTNDKVKSNPNQQ